MDSNSLLVQDIVMDKLLQIEREAKKDIEAFNSSLREKVDRFFSSIGVSPENLSVGKGIIENQDGSHCLDLNIELVVGKECGVDRLRYMIVGFTNTLIKDGGTIVKKRQNAKRVLEEKLDEIISHTKIECTQESTDKKERVTQVYFALGPAHIRTMYKAEYAALSGTVPFSGIRERYISYCSKVVMTIDEIIMMGKRRRYDRGRFQGNVYLAVNESKHLSDDHIQKLIYRVIQYTNRSQLH